MTLGILLVVHLAAWSRIGINLSSCGMNQEERWSATPVSCPPRTVKYSAALKAALLHLPLGTSGLLLRGREFVPHLPERLHLIWLAQRDAGEGIHGRERPANADVVLFEIIDHA